MSYCMMRATFVYKRQAALSYVIQPTRGGAMMAGDDGWIYNLFIPGDRWNENDGFDFDTLLQLFNAPILPVQV